MNADIEDVRALVQATIDGFNRGDPDAYMAMVDDRSLVRNAGTNSFARGAEMRPLAPMILQLMKRFTVQWEGADRLGDTVVLWGTFENVTRGPDDTDGDTVLGQFTVTCARVGETWKVACSHYSAIG
jgi:hypothetical protein